MDDRAFHNIENNAQTDITIFKGRTYLYRIFRIAILSIDHQSQK